MQRTLGTVRVTEHKAVRCFRIQVSDTRVRELYLGVEADQMPAGGHSFPPIMVVNSHDPNIMRTYPSNAGNQDIATLESHQA
jgi:hypothetical protein